MGFGSYDESEQRDQSVSTTDDEESVDFKRQDHEGKIEFETDLTADEMVNQLKSFKESDEHEGAETEDDEDESREAERSSDRGGS